MQEYIIEIWHLISVSLNIKRAPPIKRQTHIQAFSIYSILGENVLVSVRVRTDVSVIVSLFERHMRVGYTQSENVERANESKESFKSEKQQ